MVARKVLFDIYILHKKFTIFIFPDNNCRKLPTICLRKYIDSQNNLYSFIPEPVKTFVIKFV